MPEVLGSPPSPRTVLFWNGTEWQWALVDAAGHLQIDVVDAAGLQDALQSVATDRLIVRGEDQLFSFHSRLRLYQEDYGAAVGVNVFNLGSPPAGTVWHITFLSARNDTTANLSTSVTIRTAGSSDDFQVRLAPTVGEGFELNGELWLDENDSLRVTFRGCVAGDDIFAAASGFQMTLET